MNIINNSEVLGSLGKDLVLNTLGKVYIRVGDRYYELDFRKEILDVDIREQEDIERDSNLLIVKSIDNIEFPGNDKFIISLDGKFYITQNGKFKNITPKSGSNTSDVVNISLIEDANVIGKLYSDNLIIDFSSGEITAEEMTINKLKVNSLSVKSLKVPTKDQLVSGSGKLYIGPEINIKNIEISDSHALFSINELFDTNIFPIGEYVTNETESFVGRISDVHSDKIDVLIISGSPENSEKIILKGDYIKYDSKWKSIYNKTYNKRVGIVSNSGDYSDLEFIIVSSDAEINIKSGTFVKCDSNCKLSVNINSNKNTYLLNDNMLYLITESGCINLTRSIHYFETKDEFDRYNVLDGDIAFIKESEQLYYKGLLIGGKTAPTLPGNFKIENAQTGSVITYNNGIWVPSMDYATYKYVDDRLNYILNNAPSALDTLGEIAEVLQNNINDVGDIILAISNISKTLSSKADLNYVNEELLKIKREIIDVDGTSEILKLYKLLENKSDKNELYDLVEIVQSLQKLVDTKVDSIAFNSEINNINAKLNAVNIDSLNDIITNILANLELKVDKSFVNFEINQLKLLLTNLIDDKINRIDFENKVKELESKINSLGIPDILTSIQQVRFDLAKKADASVVSELSYNVNNIIKSNALVQSALNEKVDKTEFNDVVGDIKNSLANNNIQKWVDVFNNKLDQKANVYDLNAISESINSISNSIYDIRLNLSEKTNNDDFVKEINRINSILDQVDILNITSVLNTKASWEYVNQVNERFNDFASIAYTQGIAEDLNNSYSLLSDRVLKLENNVNKIHGVPIKINDLKNYNYLIYNESSNIWMNKALEINGIPVKISNLENEHILIYDLVSNSWVNKPNATTLGKLKNVDDNVDDVFYNRSSNPRILVQNPGSESWSTLVLYDYITDYISSKGYLMTQNQINQLSILSEWYNNTGYDLDDRIDAVADITDLFWLDGNELHLQSGLTFHCDNIVSASGGGGNTGGDGSDGGTGDCVTETIMSEYVASQLENHPTFAEMNRAISNAFNQGGSGGSGDSTNPGEYDYDTLKQQLINDPIYDNRYLSRNGGTISGDLTVTGGFTHGSDIRYKNVFDNINIDIKTIASAPFFNYTWIDSESDRMRIGTSAQYWNDTVFSNAVVDTETKWTIDSASIALGSAISIAKVVDNHEDRLTVLERENEFLKEKLKEYGMKWQ